MSVRTKFKVTSITLTEDWDITRKPLTAIELTAVMDGSKETDEFFRATPSGSIKFNTVNPDAASQFEVGKAYYVDITPAE